jgi:hypothetical protein
VPPISSPLSSEDLLGGSEGGRCAPPSSLSDPISDERISLCLFHLDCMLVVVFIQQRMLGIKNGRSGAAKVKKWLRAKWLATVATISKLTCAIFSCLLRLTL